MTHNVFSGTLNPTQSINQPVCNVGVWPNGWTDQDETWHAVGLGPGHIVLDGDPGPRPQRGTAPNFRPMCKAVTRLATFSARIVM